MADLALRFGKDMLVVSSPIQEALRRAGIESARDQALALLVEPETIEEAYRMEAVAGPQCLVTPVADFTPARLVAVGAEGKGEALAEAALAVMAEFKPQHTLVEIAPCGLPLDPDSKASLVENRDQYSRAAQLFDGRAFDAFFLNGFTTADDLKCALMGLRKVTDAPIIASVDVQGDGVLTSGRGTWREAVEVMVEYGAADAGRAEPGAQLGRYGPRDAGGARGGLVSCGHAAGVPARRQATGPHGREPLLQPRHHDARGP